MLSAFHDDTFTEKRRTRHAGVEVIEKLEWLKSSRQRSLLWLHVYFTTIMIVTYCVYVISFSWSYDTVLHHSIKWWKRIYHIFLDTCIVNTHILYNASMDRKLIQLEFRLAVAEGLLADYEAAKLRHRAQDPQLPLRLKERAFPEPIPNSCPDCQVCSNRAARCRHQTQYRCKICKTLLCLYPYYEEYHTFINYK